MEKVNWGIIGPGRIAESFAKGIAFVDNAVLHSVASSRKERADVFAGKYSVKNSYGSYSEMLDDPGLDAVYIATPHSFHYDNVKLCLNAGKSVLCEKPLTINEKMGRELVDLARSKNLFFMEALWSRFLPVYTDVRDWLDSSKIGDIRLICANFGINVPYDLNDRWYNPDLAGGALLDLGVYPIAVTQWILNENPVTVKAEAVMTETKVDQLTAGVLKYPSGVIMQMNCGFAAQALNDLKIYGSKGSITIHHCFWATDSATLETEDNKLTVTRPFKASGFEYEIDAATKAIINGEVECSGITLDNTLGTLRVMDDIRNQIGLKYPFE
ncbi:MAG: Gfo/Idh/MocA family oxidoreductase [Spirochaetes bacterium]|nr:Gfo/Idh/MocA family oxidoreductase [Spirochaetota bacterium]MBN2770993.1 Gfo/Idh/MocA family oxidoreductase [Spirochaetota bacterium]